MVCERYKKELIEAAAGLKPASSNLQKHLQSCAECRRALASEQALFGAIDANIRKGTNAEPPMTLIPRVRDAISNEPAKKSRWAHVWVPAAASIALIASAATWNARHATSIRDETQMSVRSDHASPSQAETVRKMPELSLPRVIKRRIAAQRSVAATADFQPLLPVGQRAAFDYLIQHIRQGRIDGKVLVGDERDDFNVPPIAIPPLVEISADAVGTEKIPMTETWSGSNRRTR